MIQYFANLFRSLNFCPSSRGPDALSTQSLFFQSFTLKFQTFHNIVFYLPVRRTGTFGDNLSESHWLQSTFPINMEGLGIGPRRVSSLALPAFLTSVASTIELQSNLLKEFGSHPDLDVEKLLTMWLADLVGLESTLQQTSFQLIKANIKMGQPTPLLQKTSSELFHPLTEKHDQARWGGL